MKKIQIVLDTKLSKATDRAAQRTRQNRSALVRDAVREQLPSLELRGLEQGTARGTHATRALTTNY